MRDKFGVEITVGCYVAYAQRSSCNAFLSIGRVVKIFAKHVQVLGVSQNWRDELTLNQRPGALTDLSRVLVLPSIPERYATLLNSK